MVPRAGIETTYITDKQRVTTIVYGVQWRLWVRGMHFLAQNLAGKGQEILVLGFVECSLKFGGGGPWA